MSKRASRRRDRSRTTPRTALASRGPRSPAPDEPGGLHDRLARLLETPHLARIVPRLAPELLHGLIRHRGLDACVDLVAAATPQQVASILDLDLWRAPAAGGDDRFDEERFGVWLETLMAEGATVAARIVATMDPALAIAGLSRYVRVFDPGVFEPTASTDDEFEAPDMSRAGALECEVGGYVVRARTALAWDAVAGLLVALADDRPGVFHALMQGCLRLSNSTPESDGLDDLMREPEQWVHDVSLGREHRRTGQGYLTPADGRAFLQMARAARPSGAAVPPSINPIVAAYFRALDAADQATPRAAPSGPATLAPEGHRSDASMDRDVAESIAALVELLGDAGTGSRALPGAVADATRVTPIQPLMEYVHDAGHQAYFARSRELAFLANALIAGCPVLSRPFTPDEARDAAVGICNLGLEMQAGSFPRQAGSDPAGTAADVPALPDEFLVDHDLITAFEAGWTLLHHDVAMFVAGRLIATLADLRTVDSAIQQDLYRLRRELERHRAAGTPWRAQEALEIIGLLDMPTWACLRGLLGECPVLPAALTAVLEKSARPVSATDFQCFTIRRQIRRVHEFAATLAAALFP